MAAPDDEYFASVERGILQGSDALWKLTVSNSTQCGLFIGEYKKYTVSGVTSFKAHSRKMS